MKINYIVLFLFSLLFVSCSSQKKLEQEMLMTLNKYREIKSSDYALHGGLWGGSAVEAFRHEEFDAIASNISKNIYILVNEFSADGIVTDKEYEKLSGVSKVYKIVGKEIIIGEIDNFQAIYYNQPVIKSTTYLITVETSTPLLLFDFMYNDRYILDKDVPALLDRLTRTGEDF